MHELFANTHLTLILFITLSHHHRIAPDICLFLNTSENAREIEVIDLRYNNPYEGTRTYTALTQRLRESIRIKIMFARECLDAFTLLY